MRVDSAHYSTAEQGQSVQREEQCERALWEKSATQRKFDPLGVNVRVQTSNVETQFIVVDTKVPNDLFAQT